MTVAIRMNADNVSVRDYYLLPRIDIAGPDLRLREENGLSLDAFRFESLEPFYQLGGRLPLGRIA